MTIKLRKKENFKNAQPENTSVQIIVPPSDTQRNQQARAWGGTPHPSVGLIKDIYDITKREIDRLKERSKYSSLDSADKKTLRQMTDVVTDLRNVELRADKLELERDKAMTLEEAIKLLKWGATPQTLGPGFVESVEGEEYAIKDKL